MLLPTDELTVLAAIMEDEGGPFDITAGKWDYLAFSFHLDAIARELQLAITARDLRYLVTELPPWPLPSGSRRRGSHKEVKAVPTTIGEWIHDATIKIMVLEPSWVVEGKRAD